jgi:hypothetical protein
MYLPEEVIRALKEIGERFQKIVLEKQEAIAEQDFDRAARLHDKGDRLKRRVLDAVKDLNRSIRERDSDSTIDR